MHPGDLLDTLLDLDHDLGKYLRLPLAMLPTDAPPPAVREALETALLRTRRGPRGVRSAAELWAGFTAEAGPALGGLSGTAALSEAVGRALAWADRLEGAIDRARAEADLGAVQTAIRALIDEVEHAG